MKIANIVSLDKVDVSIEFNVVDSIDKIIAGLPTLIVGYEYVNKNYPDFDITDICLKENIYWTFRRNEKRDKYEKDLNWFIYKVLNDLVKDISYVFVDPIQYKRKTMVKIIKKIYELPKKITYIGDNMAFIYHDKLVFGVDFKLLKYVGFDVIKIESKIKTMSDVLITKTDIKKDYEIMLKRLNNKLFYIPFLFYLKNN